MIGLKEVDRIHFIGIGGYGMSALAKLMLEMGYGVTGSDLKESGITRKLVERGARLCYYHHRDNLQGAGLVVYSTAISPDNPEMVAARARGMPLWHRSELLARLLNRGRGIAVAGTHGKTTTTALLSLVLERGGLDPTALIGGELSDFDGNARLGRGEYLVAEACESDHSFLRYRPFLAVVTNVEADHLEHYGGSFAKIKETYREFLHNLKEGGKAVICLDDPYLAEICRELPLDFITYGVKSPAQYQARDIRYQDRGCRFTVQWEGEALGEMVLGIPGEHNVSNALAALAVALELGMDFPRVCSIMQEFKGAKRRFQVIGEPGGITVVDDYAHHPTEIRATLKAARETGPGRLIAVFQPHRYTRTSYLFEDFVKAFGDASLVVLVPVYPAGEAPIAGVSSESLGERIRQEGKEVVLREKGQLEEYLQEITRPGDLVITMGAGDIWKTAWDLVGRLEEENKDRE